MKRIWSPWRIDYIVGKKPADCIFCSMPDEDNDPDNLIVLRGERCFVMLNRYPYTNGHLMVVPYEHVNMPTLLSPPTLLEMMSQANICIEVLSEAMRPDGFNLGMNIGTSAGAGIKDHVHMHIVPRWNGDTNFMPVLSDTRVIVEGLERCYLELRPLFDCRCELDAQGRPVYAAGSDQ